MTLLEIMIVLAIIAVVMGFLIGPTVMKKWNQSKVRTTKLRVYQLSYSSYASWSMNTGKRCPPSLRELTEFGNDKNTEDAWGNEFIMLCGDEIPADDDIAFAVLSLGPDEKRDTRDDIRSWDLSRGATP